ncbi:hypothetical protein EHS86_11080 [Erwinia amylovora]|uniref:Uncharacterized protein n=2 Tax=Erwinia amylovora TaxID=552 RepID=A0A831A267_ERWAM|nr:hypothetical protein AD997_01990 [Erwinia amylovora]EKV52674.1 hypothetical protein EaACW_3263 [Erwinia amylovora ACW56400]CBA23286.1 hypothetical protein predicted by Glimmer/Critica [Erwinia amylovora CFBP1430]CCO80102.1 hypothetical protein BN432_3332 [Erwinia amylovora Ea356]CCO83906.1 hypothetical protein BN433_3358 [Erwinia amylovora Ea266]CCO87668.1 hypothetical protein BN434_3308 [Erwinia amylovora CFBP 2585]CCO91459.1 hypothetical protein BN435_3316 [Erwinia amylovora 01SFR-BO]CC
MKGGSYFFISIFIIFYLNQHYSFYSKMYLPKAVDKYITMPSALSYFSYVTWCGSCLLLH